MFAYTVSKASYGTPRVSAPLIQAIEDAVLFGNVKEIESLLDLIDEEKSFPDDIRYGLESMLHFRVTYGRGGILEPADDVGKQKAQQIESGWGRELIEMIGHYPI